MPPELYERSRRPSCFLGNRRRKGRRTGANAQSLPIDAARPLPRNRDRDRRGAVSRPDQSAAQSVFRRPLRLSPMTPTYSRRRAAGAPFVILAPVIGGVIVTFLVSNFAPEAKGHGVPEVMDAIYYKEGMIRPIVALVKSLASAFAIGSGSSVGREGPIIQIGSAIGSTLGQTRRHADRSTHHAGRRRRGRRASPRPSTRRSAA